MSDDIPEPPRRRPIQREQILQGWARRFANKAITAPHLFMAFDRAAAGGKFSHARERKAGLVAGTPDTLTRVRGLPNIWVEFKFGDNKPSDAQRRIIQSLYEFGDTAEVAWSVRGYYRILLAANVPMLPAAETIAEQCDDMVTSAIAREEVRIPGKGRVHAAPRYLAGKGFVKRARMKGIRI